jgi:hypothetical protein
MEKYPKHTVLTRNGTTVRMNDAALRIAEKHFGANRQKVVTREVPPEILQLPKRIDIIKAEVKVQPPANVAPEVRQDDKKIEHDIALETIKKQRSVKTKTK